MLSPLIHGLTDEVYELWAGIPKDWLLQWTPEDPKRHPKVYERSNKGGNRRKKEKAE